MNARRVLVVGGCALLVAFSTKPAGLEPELSRERTRLANFVVSPPISAVRINGALKWASKSELEQAIAGKLTGGFFGVDIRAIRESALAVDWVRDVSVRRVWPDELHLAVVEDRPVARWAENGLMTERGTLLPVREGEGIDTLPLLSGPRHKARQIRERLFALTSVLDRMGGGIELLELSAAGNWRVGFADGVSLVFRHDQDIDVRRFAAIYPIALEGRRNSIERIDLRYPNGFAVRWRYHRDGDSRRQG